MCLIFFDLVSKHEVSIYVRLVWGTLFSGFNRAALSLFSSNEDALKFLENRADLNDAHARMLIDLGRICDAAEIYAKNSNTLKAVKILSEPTTYSVNHVRPMINYLMTGLWRDLSLGMPPASSSTASKLLAYADRLDESAMSEQEIDEVSPSVRPIGGSYTLSSPACDV